MDSRAGAAAQAMARGTRPRVYRDADARTLARARDSARRLIPAPRAVRDRRGRRDRSVAQALPGAGRSSACCYRVASALGLICIEIFGYRDPSAKSYAENIGLAPSVDQHSARHGEIAERSRITTCARRSSNARCAKKKIFGATYTPKLVSLIDFEARRAQDLYAKAQSALRPEDGATLLTAKAVRLIYAALLERVWSIITSTTSTACPAPRKLFLVGRAWAEGRLSALADR